MKRQSSQANKSTTSAQFKPYTQKDFKQMRQQTQSTRLGGLGANIGSEEWDKAQQKKQAQKLYAEQVRLQT